MVTYTRMRVDDVVYSVIDDDAVVFQRLRGGFERAASCCSIWRCAAGACGAYSSDRCPCGRNCYDDMSVGVFRSDAAAGELATVERDLA